MDRFKTLLQTCSNVMLLFLAGRAVIQAQTPLPVGGEFRINAYTTSAQSEASVSLNGVGEFVVAWESEGSYGSDTSWSSIQARRFSSNGLPIGNQFQVNTYTTDFQWNAKIGQINDSSFIVVWTSRGSSGTDSSYYSVQAQLFSSSGEPINKEFQVNTYTDGYQFRNSVSRDGAGGFIVVWSSMGSYESDTSSFSVQGRQFSSDGSPVGVEFQVNSHTTDSQYFPDVAYDPTGGFVATWESIGSNGNDSSSESIQAQRFTSAGQRIGDEIQVNSYTSFSQRAPVVRVDDTGESTIVWFSSGSNGSDSNHTSILGQRIDSGGTLIGSEFQVNSYTTNGQSFPRIGTDGSKGFVVVWHSIGSAGGDNNSNSIQAQHFSSQGVSIGSEFQVNTYTTFGQAWPAVSADGGRGFIITWWSGPNGNDKNIQSQRYVPRIFSDGFESGDLSRWSGFLEN